MAASNGCCVSHNFRYPKACRATVNVTTPYRAQGRYVAAETLFKHALAIGEKALDPKHPDVAQNLENYAALLRETGRSAEATNMEARAKHATANP